MSSGFFGRRHEPPHHQTWDAYQDHGYNELDSYAHRHSAFGTGQSSTPYTAFPRETSPMLNSHIEKKETPEAYVFKAHLPGLKRSDVRVEVDDGRVLCIVCERSVEKQEQRGAWHLVEMSSGHFVQRVMLPENSNVDHVKAYMDKGVLTITVPKYNRAMNHHVRSINISEH